MPLVSFMSVISFAIPAASNVVIIFAKPAFFIAAAIIDKAFLDIASSGAGSITDSLPLIFMPNGFPAINPPAIFGPLIVSSCIFL